MLAGILIASLPMVLLFLCMSKQFVRGLTSGAVKGWSLQFSLWYQKDCSFGPQAVMSSLLCTRKFRWNSLVHKKALRANDAHSRNSKKYIISGGIHMLTADYHMHSVSPDARVPMEDMCQAAIDKRPYRSSSYRSLWILCPWHTQKVFPRRIPEDVLGQLRTLQRAFCRPPDH